MGRFAQNEAVGAGTQDGTSANRLVNEKRGAALSRDAPFTGKRYQPKIRPLAFVVAAAKRSCTSAQLTTFQNALT